MKNLQFNPPCRYPPEKAKINDHFLSEFRTCRYRCAMIYTFSSTSDLSLGSTSFAWPSLRDGMRHGTFAIAFPLGGSTPARAASGKGLGYASGLEHVRLLQHQA